MKKIIFTDKYPNLLNEWHYDKNIGLNPLDYGVGSTEKVWWICSDGHEWKTTIKERTRGSRCPYCTGNMASIEKSLKTNYPQIASQWHPTKNKPLLPEQVTVKSSKKVWWTCEAGHEWQTAVSERTRGSGCPYCSGRYASKENNLQVLFPEISKEWNYMGYSPENADLQR